MGMHTFAQDRPVSGKPGATNVAASNNLKQAIALPFPSGQAGHMCLPTWQNLFSTLSLNERRRRLWHMLPGTLPLLWIVLPHEVPISATWQCGLLLVGTGLGAVACYHGPAFAREGEQNCLCSPISYAVVGVLPILLFPAHPEFSATALAILAFGDGSAALGGIVLRGPALPWNQDKTWAGFICFLSVSIPIASFYFWAEAEPAVNLSVAIFFAASAAVAGVIAESIPSKINDNIRVGATAIATLVLLQWCMFGW